MVELYRLGVNAIHEGIRNGRFSAQELVEQLLKRIRLIEPKVHAFIHYDEDLIIEQAKTADQQVRQGIDLPLLGVPIGIKDVIHVSGMQTTYHSKIHDLRPLDRDSECVRRLRAAGALILGKLSTHEYAIGGPTLDLPFPSARNPWNLRFHPGGSSSGSAAGLAACMFPAALGSDTGGSIRGPADACGIVGLKPTYGLVPLDGIKPLTFSFDHLGPMTREVNDLVPLLAALSGRKVESGLLKDLKGIRIGYVRAFHTVDFEADQEIVSALDAVAKDFSALGAEIKEVKLPRLQDFDNTTWLISSAESWSIHAEQMRTRSQDYCARARRRLLIGAFLSAADYVGAMRLRRYLIDRVNGALENLDALLVASSLKLTCPIDDEAMIDKTFSYAARSPFSATGHPALNFPIGLSSEGLPLGAQLVARHQCESLIIDIASIYEQSRSRPRYPALK